MLFLCGHFLGFESTQISDKEKNNFEALRKVLSIFLDSFSFLFFFFFFFFIFNFLLKKIEYPLTSQNLLPEHVM
jgi:hypothetical protein